MARRIWFQRAFTLGTPLDHFPEIVERLRGTPARLEERVAGVREDRLRARPHDAWSIQEQVGHLSDLEPLWAGRVDDLAASRAVLRAADLENRATWDADHNARPMSVILAEFRERRAALVATLEALDENGLRATALHPRLEQPMTVVDLGFFVAEHDDHHLAAISGLLR